MQLNPFSQRFRPFDGFTLLEVILSVLMLVIMTLSAYNLFQVNINTSKLASDLDAADRELFGNMQQIRRLGASFNWCQGQASTDPANCTVLDAAGNKYMPLTQGYYQQNDVQLNSNFSDNCRVDAGSYSSADRRYTLAYDLFLKVLVDEIEKVPNYKRVDLVEKATRRLLVLLEKNVTTEAFGTRTVTRYLYLVPEVAKWCPA